MRPTGLLFLVAALQTSAAHAQSGGFVATLGNDTVHVERFTRSGNVLDGTIVTRVPVTRTVKYRMTFTPAGSPLKYEVSTFDASGNPVAIDGSRGSLTFVGDSVARETLEKGAMTTQMLYAPNGVFPTPSIPYVGVSYLMYEQAFRAARLRGSGAGDTSIYLVTMLPFQKSTQRSRIWFPAKDSAELDYFGVARSGYHFDADGHLDRADWRGTTYRYRVSRVADVDVDRLARAWATADTRGAGVGALSPRDSSKGVAGTAQLSVQYSRPSRRGRDIWGDVVQPDVVWRLGADMATHFSTSADIKLGDTVIPAGRYTLWMIMSRDGQAQLIVNKRVNIFGTQYDPRSDFARIPLHRADGTPPVEKLTLSLDGGQVSIAWGSATWSVPVKPAQ